MTVRQLIETLQRINSPDTAEVCVQVTKCLSPYTGEPVTRVYNGFDWEAGKVMLCTGSPLIRESPDSCRRCGMYGIKAAARITSRVSYVDLGTGDMGIAVYLDGKKKFSVPFNARSEMRGKEDK